MPPRLRRKTARAEETRLRGLAASAKLARQEIETELSTLTKLLAPSHDWAPIVEQVRIEAGYEQALGAALGDDLDAASEDTAPAHWRKSGDGSADPKLPEGATPLSRLCQSARGAGAPSCPDRRDRREPRRTQCRRPCAPGSVSSPGTAIFGAGTATAFRPARRARQAPASIERSRLEALKGRRPKRSRPRARRRPRWPKPPSAARRQRQTVKTLRQHAKDNHGALDRARETIAAAEHEAQANSKQLGALAEALTRTKSGARGSERAERAHRRSAAGAGLARRARNRARSGASRGRDHAVECGPGGSDARRLRARGAPAPGADRRRSAPRKTFGRSVSPMRASRSRR